MGCAWAKAIWFASLLGFNPNQPDGCKVETWLLDRINHEELEILEMMAMIC